MRNISQHRWGYLCFFTCLCVLFVLLNGTALADIPVFTIDNGYEREDVYDPAGWIVTENLNQKYTLDWGETFSSRLDVDLGFRLSIDDTHNSKGVDSKQVSPRIDFTLVNPVWDFAFLGEDQITYTNEFNKERKDAIQYSAQLNLIPYLIPPLWITYSAISNDQEGLEDSVDKKFDVSSAYSFGEMIELDASWKRTTFDDQLKDFNDRDEQSWDVHLSLNQLLTETIKLNFESTWDGRVDDTLDNSGNIIERDESETLENQLRLTLDAFPRIFSELDLSNIRELVENTEESDVAFTFEMTQDFLFLGTLIESLQLSRGRNKSPVPQEDSTELEFDFTLEFTGVPSKYLGYTISQSLNLTDSEFTDSALDTDTRTDDFNLSLTVIPISLLVFDTALTQSVEYEEGSRTGESKDLKIEITYDGVLLFPNLTFEPSLQFTTETDFVKNETTKSDKIDLLFSYDFNLPPGLLFFIDTNYILAHTDGVKDQEELTFDNELSWDFIYGEWRILLKHKGRYTKPLFGEETESSFESDYTFQSTTVLIGNMFLDIDYRYKTFSDEDDEDSLEVSLDWEFYRAILSLSFEREQTFAEIRDETRLYSVEFFMEF